MLSIESNFNIADKREINSPTSITFISESFKFDDDSLTDAIKMWFSNVDKATQIYGHISLWDVSRVENFAYLFAYSHTFNEDISKWNVSNGKTMEGMFLNATHFNQDISSWDVRNVTDFSKMFANTEKFNAPISTWNFNKTADLSYMFYNTKSFNQDLRLFKIYRNHNTTCMIDESSYSLKIPDWYCKF